MKTFVTAVGLAMGASAAILPRNDQCCFTLTASGGVDGTLGQLKDGQNRVGGNLGTATYCINNGQITDSSGYGCILTPPTTQFQCDKGATPQSGFSINSNSMLQYQGDTTFYACPADSNEYNIYTTPVKNQPKCVKVTLSTGGKCVPAQQTTTCPAPSTIYKTEYSTEYKPTTVYKTNEMTEYQPTTVYNTKTMEETEYKTVPTTVYQTKTQQVTVTNETPTTVYQTKTAYETATATTTAYETKTAYQTKTVETTEYKTMYQTKTAQAPPNTVTQVVTHTAQCPTQYVTETNTNKVTKTVVTTPNTSPAAPTATGKCPAELNGEWQYPHLIVPMSSEHPHESYGTSYNGMMNSSMSSMYNFDIPQSYQGMTCELVFMFPKKENLETSSYTWSGEGSCSVEHMDNVCKESDSWSSMSHSGSHMGSFSPKEGNAYTIWTGACPAGTAQTYEMSAEGGMSMEFFQDYNPCPLGLYMKAY